MGEIKLIDVEGIGPSTAEKLKQAGITVPSQLSIMTADEVKNILQCSRKVAAKYVNSAKAIAPAIILSTAKEVMEYRDKNIQYISTGSRNLDRLLRGGFPTGIIVGLTGQFCHDENTKVLTLNGRKDYSDIKIGDKILGMNNKGEIVKTTVLDTFEDFYSGEMIELSSRRYNMKVTPEHEIYYLPRYKKEFQKIKVKELKKKHGGHLKIQFKWNGLNKDVFDIHDFIEINKKLEYPQKSHPKPNLRALDTDLFLELLGWYISEGSIFRSKRENYVQIRNRSHLSEIKSILESLGLDYSIYDNSKFVIFHRDLAKYIERCGTYSWNKRIPKEIFELSRKHLKHLFDAYMKGDGNKNKWNAKTVSPLLRDQLIVLSLILGNNAFSLETEMRNAKMNDGRIIKPKHQGYRINFAYSGKGYLDKRINFNVDKNYKGKIWCFTTETGNFFTIRNGVPTLSGNSSGKTQLCNEAVVSCLSDLKRKAIWIQTEARTFDPERLIEIAKAKGREINLNNVVVIGEFIKKKDPKTGEMIEAPLINNPSTLMRALKRVAFYIEHEGNDVGVVIIDSFTAPFRRFLSGREMLPDRSRETAREFGFFNELIAKHNISLVLTVQVMGSPVLHGAEMARKKFAIPYIPWGGHVLKHSVQYWIGLYQVSSTDNTWSATTFDCPLPRDSVIFKIDESGVRD